MSYLTTDARPTPMPLASAEKEARVISIAEGSRNPGGEFWLDFDFIFYFRPPNRLEKASNIDETWV